MARYTNGTTRPGRIVVVLVPVGQRKSDGLTEESQLQTDLVDGAQLQVPPEGDSGPLAKVIDQLRKIRLILALLLELKNLLGRHRKVVGIVALSIALYTGLVYWVFCRPARTIFSFYNAIEAGHSGDAAYYMLYSGYRDERWKDAESFADGFRTTVCYTDMHASYVGHAWNPVDIARALIRGYAEYDVSFTVRDRFTRGDLGDLHQQQNMLWLRIAHPTKYEQLKSGQLLDAMGNPARALEITRSYKKKFEVRRVSGHLLISHIDTVEETLKRQLQ